MSLPGSLPTTSALGGGAVGEGDRDGVEAVDDVVIRQDVASVSRTMPEPRPRLLREWSRRLLPVVMRDDRRPHRVVERGEVVVRERSPLALNRCLRLAGGRRRPTLRRRLRPAVVARPDDAAHQRRPDEHAEQARRECAGQSFMCVLVSYQLVSRSAIGRNCFSLQYGGGRWMCFEDVTRWPAGARSQDARLTQEEEPRGHTWLSGADGPPSQRAGLREDLSIGVSPRHRLRWAPVAKRLNIANRGVCGSAGEEGRHTPNPEHWPEHRAPGRSACSPAPAVRRCSCAHGRPLELSPGERRLSGG